MMTCQELIKIEQIHSNAELTTSRMHVLNLDQQILLLISVHTSCMYHTAMSYKFEMLYM